MADNGLSKDGFHPQDEQSRVTERRAFFKRAAAIGLPVALATVRANTAWAQTNDTASCRASLGTSGCAARNNLFP